MADQDPINYAPHNAVRINMTEVLRMENEYNANYERELESRRIGEIVYSNGKERCNKCGSWYKIGRGIMIHWRTCNK